jgi:hypothetical protein
MDREIVRDRKRTYELNGAEAEALATPFGSSGRKTCAACSIVYRETDRPRMGCDVCRSPGVSKRSHLKAETLTSSL